ncbi:probable CoA ligase CCL6 isoform X2 [Cryptomeria japonica]|uniref:probable CoA ligase CCL6 isoform X2 n=1 Tax=Cryptomeria japonica TaxID=3369 RepID=UPI0027DA3A88|nr:probable CoA ligase CCL6 isoform X2 [Cryptomeria japonica]
MENIKNFAHKVEEGKDAQNGEPSHGPVYRNVFAKDGFAPMPPGIESCWDMFSQSVQKRPHNQMLGHREIENGKAGKYVWLTYQEAYDLSIQIGSAIRSCDVGSGGRSGIYGVNCPEWIISMQACNSHGIYCIPLYDTLGPEAIEFIICHAEVSIAFVQESKIPAILECLPKCTKYLKTFVSFANISDGQREVAERAGVNAYSWAEFLSLGKKKIYEPSPPKKNDICTIMYTSGTTGEPKGVLLTNENIIAEISSIDHLLDITDKPATETDVYISFLPLAHVFDRAIEEYCIYKSASIGFWRGDVKLLVEDIVELKPTIFCGVPRVFDRIYTGLTETCAGSFSSLANVFSMIGTVGPPATIIEAKLKSVPEMGYDALSKTPRGEICIRGKTLFSGYYKREDMTNEVLVDGWFHTGDIGEWQQDGTMKIIDRKKNIFKLSQGEYVAVENIENVYNRCSSVASIWVYGNSFESFLVAVVIPNPQALESWATANGESGNFESLCQNPKANKYILDELNATGKKHKLKGFELLRQVHLEPNPFSVERDLITPTFKMKRPQLLNYYKDIIDDLYRSCK